MLVPSPIVCFIGAFAADILFVWNGEPGWATASNWLLGICRASVLIGGGGLLVLLLIAVLAVFKPRGMTRYGWRKQNERTDALS